MPIKKKAESKKAVGKKKKSKKKEVEKDEVKKKKANIKKKTILKKKETVKKPVAAKKKAVKKAVTAKKKAAKKPVAAKKKAVKKPVAAKKKAVKKKEPEKKIELKKKAIEKEQILEPQVKQKVAPQKKAPPIPVPVIESQSLKKEVSTLLVTGASGCIGGYLIKHLLKDGYSVIAVDSAVDELPSRQENKPLVAIAGDISNPQFVASCMENVDAVFHVADYMDRTKLTLDSGRASIKAVQVLYQEARRRSVKRFILINSASVYKRQPGLITEKMAFEAQNEYEQNLIEIDRIISAGAMPGLPLVTVLRPALIYGPRCKRLMASVAALSSLVKTMGPYYIQLSGGPRMNMVHGEDVARAGIFLLFLPNAYGEAFNVGDKDPMVFGEYVNVAMEAYGLDPLGPGTPYPPSTLLQSILPYVEREEIFNPLGQLSSILWDRLVRSYNLRKNISPRIDQELISFGSRDFIVDNRKLRALGFRLKHPKFQKGWEQTIAWYQRNRWIPRAEEIVRAEPQE